MKRTFFGFCAAAAVMSFASCSNSADTSNTKDSSSTTTNTTATTNTTETGTATSTGNYAAMADSIERNASAGYYVNPRTGKKYSSLKVDRTTGRITDDAGEPVWRFVDNRNWWVYGDDNMDDAMYNWNQVGEAKDQSGKIMYKGDGDKWVDYDTRWKKDDSDLEQKWKSADGDTKIKVEKDGDMKIKDGDTKIKYDAKEGETKIKEDGKKTKIDKDGNVKKD